MPEFNVVFILFPTEKDFFAADNGGKIDQPAIEVFELDFARFKFAGDLLQLAKSFDPGIDFLSAQIAAISEKFFEVTVGFDEPAANLLQLLEPFADGGQQSSRFFARVVLLEPVPHDHSGDLAAALSPSFFLICSFGSSLSDFFQASRAFPS